MPIPSETLPELANVIGTDARAPWHYRDGTWRIWNYNQLWFGFEGAEKFVPNVGDEVHQIEGYTLTRYVVIAIHPQTLVPTLRQIDEERQTDPLSPDDILFGVGPGTQSDTYRIYIDKSVTPYRLTVDQRLYTGGSQTLLCKIFKGTDTSFNGVVISGVYNQNGEMISENIPMELAARNDLTNYAWRTVTPCHTTFDLNDGEVVTAVFYDSLGFVVSKRQLLVENTAYIRSTDASRRYVTSIALETPFMSVSNQKLITYPMNIPLTALNLIGVVNYSDGSTTRYAVDNTKFTVQGLDSYAPTISNQKTKIVLKYALGINEYAVSQHIGNEVFISEEYHIQAAEINGNYAVKLYAYPVWVDAVTGYRLEWFLHELDRGIRYLVTPHVRINTNKSVFSPKAYGTQQTLHVSINLKDVNGAYKNFWHVQITDVLLVRPGSERPDINNTPNWYVSAVSGETPLYGQGVYCTYFRVATNSWRLRLQADTLSLSEWLATFFERTRPLYNPYTETESPLPTHFRLLAGGNSVEYEIHSWNQDIMLTQPITNNSTVYLQFFRRTIDTDLQLCTAGVSCWQVDSVGNLMN